MSLVYWVHEDDYKWSYLTHSVEAALHKLCHSLLILKMNPNMKVTSLSLLCQFGGSLLDA